jgi:hypothetical protein
MFVWTVALEKTVLGCELWKNRKSFVWKLLRRQFFSKFQISDLKNNQIFKSSNFKYENAEFSNFQISDLKNCQMSNFGNFKFHTWELLDFQKNQNSNVKNWRIFKISNFRLKKSRMPNLKNHRISNLKHCRISDLKFCWISYLKNPTTGKSTSQGAFRIKLRKSSFSKSIWDKADPFSWLLTFLQKQNT